MLMKNCVEASDALVQEKLEAAERAGIRGDTEASQALLAEANKIKAKQAKFSGSFESKDKEENMGRMEDICDVCGTTIMRGDTGKTGFGTADGHFKGAVCVGWGEIRKSLRKMQQYLKEAPKLEEPEIPKNDDDGKSKARRNSDDRDRRGGRSRSRGRDQKGDRSDRGRDRDDRGRGDRDRSRDRGRDRESGRDRRSDRPEKKKEVKDEFGRSKA